VVDGEDATSMTASAQKELQLERMKDGSLLGRVDFGVGDP
jgi:hypothetical protein